MENENKNGDEKIVVVGGAGGIGSAIIDKYSHLGLKVIIGDIDKDAGQRLSDKYGEEVKYYPVDVLEPDSIHNFVNNIEQDFDSVTHLVSLAGGALPDEFNGLKNTSIDAIYRSIDLNLASHVALVKEFMPLIEKDRNDNKTITLISSINAERDYGLPPYSSAKGGLISLVYSSVGELAEKNIRINSISPGTVPTPKTLKQDKDFDNLLKGVPLKRFATPREIADVVYAFTHIMTCVTGQNLNADCGQTRKTYSIK